MEFVTPQSSRWVARPDSHLSIRNARDPLSTTSLISTRLRSQYQLISRLLLRSPMILGQAFAT